MMKRLLRKVRVTKKKASWFAVGCGLLTCLAIAGGWYWYEESNRRELVELIVSPGSPHTLRHSLASLISKHARPLGVRTHLVETRGSEETLDRLEKGTLDVGLISGGFRHPPDSRIIQLATIGVEPLHLLVKPDLAANSDGEGLSILRGKRVHVGVQGSGVFALATELLSMAGLQPNEDDRVGEYEQFEYSHDDLWLLVRDLRRTQDPLEKRKLIAKLPDAVFLLCPMPSATVTELMLGAGYKIMPLPYADSFRINGTRVTGENEFRIERRLVKPMKIPANSYGLAPAMPRADIDTIGVSTIVVARPGLSSEAIHRLIKTLYESPFASEVPASELSAAHFEYPAPAALTWYFESRSPVVLRDFVETMQNALSVFGAFSAGVFTVYGYYRRRRGRSAEAYAAEIGALEHAIWDLINNHPRNDETADFMRRCEIELASIKRRIVADYTHGRLPNDTVFSNLLSLIADARTTLLKGQASPRQEFALRRARRTVEGENELDTYPRRAAG